MDRSVRIGVIGCGLRSGVYLKELNKSHCNEFIFTAVADPSEKRAMEFIRTYGTQETKYFRTHQDMLDSLSLDGVIVGSPNGTHARQADDLYTRKIPFLLEKPVATKLEDCKKLMQASHASNTPSMVGFVLRYSPFYSKVKELVRSGIIGRVLTINATEPIGSPLVILFNRSWRREEEIAGPFILEKCCHDLDVIRMIADSNAETVVSFGKRSHFNHHNQPASHCSVCSIEKSCIYSSRNNSARVNQYSQNVPNDDYEGMLEKIGAIQGEQDICVYNDFEHPDHQTVSIVFENGVLANFLYVWGQYNQSPVDHKHTGTGRTIQVCGSSGQIVGNFDDNELTVIHWEDGKGPRRDVISIKTDGSGHGGSEASLTDTFLRMIRGEECEIKATVEDGVEAARLSLAADLSRKTGRIVTMKDLDLSTREDFRYA